MTRKHAFVFGLAAVLASLALSAQGATSFTEDFSDDSANPNMELGTGYGTPTTDFTDDFTITSGDGHRIYLGTKDTDYSTTDFVFEADVTVPAAASDWSMIFFGMGTSEAYASYYGEPDMPGLYGILGGEDHPAADGAFYHDSNGVTKDFNPYPWSGVTNVGSLDDATHRLRMVWDATSQEATFSIDVGNDGTFDYTSGALDGSDNGFDATNSQLFVGGGAGLTFDNISIVPEPSSVLLLIAGLLGLLSWRRRIS